MEPMSTEKKTVATFVAEWKSWLQEKRVAFATRTIFLKNPTITDFQIADEATVIKCKTQAEVVAIYADPTAKTFIFGAYRVMFPDLRDLVASRKDNSIKFVLNGTSYMFKLDTLEKL